MQTSGPALEGALNCYGLTASRKLEAGEAENIAPEAHAHATSEALALALAQLVLFTTHAHGPNLRENLRY